MKPFVPHPEMVSHLMRGKLYLVHSNDAPPTPTLERGRANACAGTQGPAMVLQTGGPAMQHKPRIEHNEHTDGDADGLGCARGLMWAAPCGIVCWAALLWLIF